jgi:hypothetical protein
VRALLGAAGRSPVAEINSGSPAAILRAAARTGRAQSRTRARRRPASAARFLLADAHDEFGILVERRLALDEPARHVRGHRADHVGDFVRLGEDAAADPGVVEQPVQALIAAHGNVGDGVDP